jgi:hypothetical protein
MRGRGRFTSGELRVTQEVKSGLLVGVNGRGIGGRADGKGKERGNVAEAAHARGLFVVGMVCEPPSRSRRRCVEDLPARAGALGSMKTPRERRACWAPVLLELLDEGDQAGPDPFSCHSEMIGAQVEPVDPFPALR